MKSLSLLGKILNVDLLGQIQSTRILVVGAGGIGCELIKNLVLCGFRYITIIDMDGVDISNLNRQFFFRRKHIGMSKSMVIAQEASLLLKRYYRNDTIDFEIKGLAENILNFGTDFFKKFDIVLNALDNVSARSYVNKLCIASNIELIDAGSAGFSGQVHPIIPRVSRCYECTPPPIQKSFPICTIRLTPDKPQHCIAWSKNLFEIIFGTNENSKENRDNILSDITNEVRIDFDSLRNAKNDDENEIIDLYIKNTFNFLFSTEIIFLSKNEIFENGKLRQPTPISWDESQKHRISEIDDATSNKKINGKGILSIKESADLFYESTYKLINKKKNNATPLVFDKDHKSIMDFVFAASNIRSYNFHIKSISRWECQSIAGSIIPAIASTNAIVAGTQVVQLLLLLKSKFNALTDKKPQNNLELNCVKFVWIRNIPIGKFLICPEQLDKSNPKCLACSQKMFRIVISSFENWSLYQFVINLLCKHLELLEPIIELDGKCIWDPDLISQGSFKEKTQRKLSEWNFYEGCIITVTDYSRGEFQCDVIICTDNEVCSHSGEDTFINKHNNEKFVIEIDKYETLLDNDASNPSNDTDDIPHEINTTNGSPCNSTKRKEIDITTFKSVQKKSKSEILFN